MSWEVRQGHVLTRLAEMPAGSVQCVVTSPPYWGLRDYGTATWDGGSEECDHVEREIRTGQGLAEWSAEHAAGGAHKAGQVDRIRYGDVCAKCGARRVDEQLGLEATPEEFVANLVAVFAEVRRVLRADGTVWLNIGDSYARSAGDRNGHFGRAALGVQVPTGRRDSRRKVAPDLKDKDLVGVPWMLAFALRADGWYLRSEVVWAKPNPMPESVTDRPTSAHEKLFLLAKSPRYFYDADAIREESPELERRRGDTRRPSDADQERLANGYAGRRGDGEHGGGRNKRNVWEIATQPYEEAHFAVFPTKLVEPCVLAGSSPRACGVCGAPWGRLTERSYVNPGNRSTNGPRSVERKHLDYGTAGFAQRLEARVRTLGWRSTCEHDDDSGRCLVLDPFAGSGTTGVVARWLGRDFVGVELSAEYAEMARRRIDLEGKLGRRAYQPEPVQSESLF